MPRIVVLVGTRKGVFLLESDGARALELRGPVLRGLARSTTRSTIRPPARSTPPPRASGTARRSGGAPTSARRGSCRARASRYADDGLRLSKVSGLAAAHGRVLAGGEAAGIFESRDGGATWSLLTTLDGQPGRERLERSRRTSRRATSACRRSCPHPDEPDRFWVVVQGFGVFETTDGGASWTPRNRGLRAEWPREDREVGFCVHKLVMAPATASACTSRTTAACTAATTAGRSWTEITEGLPTDFGFAAAAHPHDRDMLLRDPARSGPRALHAGGPRRGLAHPRRRLELAAPRRAACRSATRTSACCARAWRSTRSTSPASTSARARARSSRAPTRATAGARSRATCPAIASVEVAVVG